MMMRVEKLEDFIKLSQHHLPVFISIDESIMHPGIYHVTLTAVSKLNVPIMLVIDEICRSAGDVCINMFMKKYRDYLNNVFEEVYEGEIND